MLAPSPDALAATRRTLGAFLRSRREALSPMVVGLGQSGRRRTPGLRREEVAGLGGISTTWYTFVEQGRDVALSAHALARLASALRLSPAERAYLFELARRRDPEPAAAPAGLPPELRAVVDHQGSPAYVLDRLWRARAWNGAAAHLLAPWLLDTERLGPEPCLLDFVFLSPHARTFLHDWDERARRVLAEFRADLARSPDDPELAARIAALKATSPDFAMLWSRQAVLAREGGERRFNHPQDGPLRYEQVTLVPATHPDHKLVVLLRG